MTANRTTIPSTDDVLDRLETDEEGGDEVADRVRTALGGSAGIGSIALLAGGALVIAAVRSATRGRRRAAIQGLAGTALFALGYRMRRRASSGDEGLADLEIESPTEAIDELRSDEGADDDADAGSAEKDVADDAHASLERHDVGREPETTASGTVGDEPTLDDGGDDPDGADPASNVSFTDEGNEPRAKPDLDADAEDPRRNDADDGDEVEVDVSDAALADEASEATGPDPEQAQPTRTEDTEPEPSPSEDASHVASDVPDGDEASESDDEGDDW